MFHGHLRLVGRCHSNKPKAFTDAAFTVVADDVDLGNVAVGLEQRPERLLVRVRSDIINKQNFCEAVFVHFGISVAVGGAVGAEGNGGIVSSEVGIGDANVVVDGRDLRGIRGRNEVVRGFRI